MGARDPAAPIALRAYARAARNLGMDSEYTDDLDHMAIEWEKYRKEHGDGDPDAPRHRVDDPTVVVQLKNSELH